VNTKYDVTDQVAEPCETWSCLARCNSTSETHNFKRLNVYKMAASGHQSAVTDSSMDTIDSTDRATEDVLGPTH